MINNESKIINYFRRIIFQTITILDFIIIIHEYVYLYGKKGLGKNMENGDIVTRFWYTFKILDLGVMSYLVPEIFC